MANRLTPLSSGILDVSHEKLSNFAIKLTQTKLQIPFQRILAGEEVHGPFVIQLISAKKLGGAPGSDAKPRYRFVISDGRTLYSTAILGTEHNALYESGQLDDMSIVRINRHVLSTVNRNEGTNRQVILMFDVDPLHRGSGEF